VKTAQLRGIPFTVDSVLAILGSSLKSLSSRIAIESGSTLSHIASSKASEMSLGPVSLVVKDLDSVLDFYVKGLGLNMKTLDSERVELRASEQSSEPLLILRHRAKIQPAPMDAAGLYHYALLLPNRSSLAAAYMSLGKAGVMFDGHADHLVSEALYLTDPEGNGIEIYADKPRNEWKYDEDGKVQMGTEPLDIDSLLRELDRTSQEHLKAIPEGTRVGHIHLKVTDLGRSIAFYQAILGLDLMSYWESAAFLSVGGYHHHLGMNTWESLRGPTRFKGWSGLEYFAMKLPKSMVSEMTARLNESQFMFDVESGKLSVSDPDGIELLIEPV
jgi:catechol 2,3-dioxygenase